MTRVAYKAQTEILPVAQEYFIRQCVKCYFIMIYSVSLKELSIFTTFKHTHIALCYIYYLKGSDGVYKTHSYLVSRLHTSS
jgi:hypothetical protein